MGFPAVIDKNVPPVPGPGSDSTQSANDSRASGGTADRWQRFDIVARTVSSLLLPLAILVLGQHYTAQQQRIETERLQRESAQEEKQRQVQRVESFINHLASSNRTERLLSVLVLTHFTNNDQFPPELLPAVIELVNDADADIARAASTTLASAAAGSPTIARTMGEAISAQSAEGDTIRRAGALDPDLARSLPHSVTVRFESTPPGAYVFIVAAKPEHVDGPAASAHISTKPLGVTNFSAPVLMGDYRFRFLLPGHAPFETDVRLQPNTIVRVDLR